MALGAKFNQRSITNFRDRLVGGGARPNMFEVNITLPEQIIPKVISLLKISDLW